jgi:hypothetical protein
MRRKAKKARAGYADLPENLPASADHDCGDALLGQIAPPLQPANTAGPRHAPIDRRSVYLLRLRAQPNTDAVHNLRALLKVAVRRFKLRCISARVQR